MDLSTLGRVPPQAIEAEQSVIGSILLEPSVYEDVTEILPSEEFYREDHKEIFAAIEELYKTDSTIDILTVSDVLKKRGTLEQVSGLEYLSEIASRVPTTANVKHYADIVHDKFMLRSMIRTSSAILDTCYSESEPVENIIQMAETQILKVNEAKVLLESNKS